MANFGAPSALRGYRLQALYTLQRLLHLADDQILQLEDREDLEVQTDSGKVVEVIQVKGKEEKKLTTSALATTPKKSDSKKKASATKEEPFFRRVLRRHAQFPDARERLVSFGPLGPQLENAWKENGNDRKEILKLLAGWKYSATESTHLIEHLQLQRLQEGDVENEVMELLRTSIAGCDPNAAFQLLHVWLYWAAEKRLRIKRSDLLAKIDAVGRFVTDRTAFHLEWGSTIRPLRDEVAANSEELIRQFNQGVAAQYEHICAGADIVRLSRLTEMAEAFSRARVVVLHGASGQGKSTLAHRFLREMVPDFCRFEIKNIEDTRHALRIATALSGHFRALDISPCVYIDVAPGSSNWVHLCTQLQYFPGITVLITIREEDWARARISSGSIEFVDIPLTLSLEEAKEFYDKLRQEHPIAHVLTFGEAWERFGSGGPLLEFAFFLRQNLRLSERLATQVVSIQENIRKGEADPAEIEFLRQVSIVSAYGGRVDSIKLAKSTNLRNPARSVEMLENEYLIHTSANGTLATGLHPVRSEILVGIMIDRYSTWSTSANASLNVICEEDLEEFLLCAFSRRSSEEIALLISALTTLKLQTWSGVLGVLRALAWVGLKQYAESNRTVVADAQSQVGIGWELTLFVDVGNVGSIAPSIPETAAKILQHAPPERQAEITSLRSRLTPKDCIYDLARDWTRRQLQHVEVPAAPGEWAAAAEVCFFAAIWKEKLPFNEEAQARMESALVALPLETLADMIFALHLCGDSWAADLIARTRPIVMTRFRQETMSMAVEDVQDCVRAHYILGFETLSSEKLAGPRSGSDNVNDDVDVHQETLRRVALLRRLFPERGFFGGQAYGHRSIELELPTDPSSKGRIPKDALPPPWLVRFNAIFGGIAEYSSRPDDWFKYFDRVTTARRACLLAFSAITDVVASHLASPANSIQPLFTPDVEGFIRESLTAMEASLLLPKSAVDEWGFHREQLSRNFWKVESGRSRRFTLEGPGLARWSSFVVSYRNHLRHRRNFLEQCPGALTVLPLLGRTSGELRERAVKALRDTNLPPHRISLDCGRLPMSNLREVMRSLNLFQAEVRALCADTVYKDDGLDKEERDGLLLLTSIWEHFAQHPDWADVKHPKRFLPGKYNSAYQSFQTRVQETIKKIEASATVMKFGALLNGRSALVVTFTPLQQVAAQGVAEQILQGLSALTATLASLERAVLDANYEDVWIVPLARGRLLYPSGWRLPVAILGAGLAAPSESWYLYARQQLPFDSLSELGVSLWELPDLTLVRDLQSALLACLAITWNMRDLSRVEVDDSLDTSVVAHYVDRVRPKALQQVALLCEVVVRTQNFLESVAESAVNPERLCVMRRLASVAGGQIVEHCKAAEVGYSLTSLADLGYAIVRNFESMNELISIWTDEVVSRSA